MPVEKAKTSVTNPTLVETVNIPKTESSNQQRGSDVRLQNLEADARPSIAQQQSIANPAASQDDVVQPSHIEHGAVGLASGDALENDAKTQTEMMESLAEIREGSEHAVSGADVRSTLNTMMERADALRVMQMTPQDKEDIQYAGKYIAELDSDMEKINLLSERYQNDIISESEISQLNGLLKSHKRNMALLQTWLEEKRSAFTSPVARGIAEILSGRLVERHMHLADQTALCVDGLPTTEPVGRDQRVRNAMVDVKSAMQTLKALPQYMQNYKIYAPVLSSAHAKVADLNVRLEKLFKSEQMPSGVDFNKSLSQQMVPAQSWDGEIQIAGGKSGALRAPEELAKTPEGKAMIEHWKQVAEAGSGDYFPLSAKGLSNDEMLTLFIHRSIKNAPGYQKKDMPDLPFIQKQSRVKVLNEKNPGSWKALEKQVEFPHHRKNYAVTSTIVPAVDEKGHGSCSADRFTQTQKVPNLALTRVSDQKGKALFEGLRHGVLTPYHMVAKNLACLPRAEIKQILDEAKKNSPEAARLLAMSSNEERLIDDIKGDKKTAKRLAGMLRVAGAENMAKILIASTVDADPELVKQALEGKTPTVTLNSISMVSPDPFRGRFGRRAGGSERNMLTTQKEALQAAQGLREISVRDPDDGKLKKVNVNVKVNSFNFGVNMVVEGGKGRSSRRSRLARSMTGWNFSMEMDKPALTQVLGNLKSEQLGGQVQEKLTELKEREQNLSDQEQRLNTVLSEMGKNLSMASKLAGNKERQLAEPPIGEKTAAMDEAVKNLAEREIDAAKSGILSLSEKKEKVVAELAELRKDVRVITDLATQVKTMANDRSYMSGGHEPYKMVSRLALLSHKLGHKTAFNCKSGKDRTGQLDAEVKYLAAVSDLDGRVPEPNKTPTSESQRAKTQFALHTGNLEMQAYNTGLPGYKTKLGSLKRQMETEAWQVYRGGSDWVSS